LAARVNNQTITIKDLDDHTERLVHFYKYSKQQYEVAQLRQQALANLIDTKLIGQYASAHNIKVSQSQVNELYAIKVSNNTDEKNLLDKLIDLYGISKMDYIENLRQDIERDLVVKNANRPMADLLAEWRSRCKITTYQ
jgi:hypothetical protein